MNYSFGAAGQIVRGDGATIPEDPANQDYRDYLSWVAGGGKAASYIPPPPTQEALDAQAARAYAKLQALRGMTPAQVQSWIDANINNLADAKDALKTLAVAVCILARRI